jgi:hypothetical protein
MPVNYQNSKIYKLVGNDKIYIGSTTVSLCKRRQQHLTTFKNNTSNIASKEIMCDPNHYIELIEYFPCNTKEELYKRERYWIENTNSINKRIPSRTKKEYHEVYYDNNKEQVLQKSKQNYENNKEKILERHKKYRETNKERISQKRKEYYQRKKLEREQQLQTP